MIAPGFLIIDNEATDCEEHGCILIYLILPIKQTGQSSRPVILSSNQFEI